MELKTKACCGRDGCACTGRWQNCWCVRGGSPDLTLPLCPIVLPRKASGLRWEYLLGNPNLLKSRRGLLMLQDEQVAF